MSEFDGIIIDEKNITFDTDVRCCECGDIIKSGNKFNYKEIYFEKNNEYKKYYTCLDCVSIAKEFFGNNYYPKYLFYDFWKIIMKCGGVIDQDKIDRLTEDGRGKVKKDIDEYWGR
ncbi:MAG: hypothetical protein ACP6IY_22660 [Promethearchaeia archaeon]